MAKSQSNLHSQTGREFSKLRAKLLDRWKQGERLRVERLLASCESFPVLTDDEMLELIYLEFDLRSKAGESPVAADFLRRFPELHDRLERLFAVAAAFPIEAVESPPRARTPSKRAEASESVERSNESTPPPDAAQTRTPAPPEKTSQTGKRIPKGIGRYQILGELGVGGFGVVYKAHDPQMDREVAIKLLRDDRAGSDKIRSRFMREARVVASIFHPHICPIFSIHKTEANDAVVLVFPFLEGETLATALKSRRFEPAEATKLIYTLALALDHAHQKGIVHRDLKPANIMIDAVGEPVIMDFGLACRAEAGDTRLTAQGDLMGTPNYMSPEQARGETDLIGTPSDIYSLGVIFYELLCGERPYSGPLTSLLSKIQSGKFTTPTQHCPDLDQRLNEICLKAMSLRPQNRFQSMSDFAMSLSAPLSEVSEDSLAEPVPKPSAEKRTPGKTTTDAANARRKSKPATRQNLWKQNLWKRLSRRGLLMGSAWALSITVVGAATWWIARSGSSPTSGDSSVQSPSDGTSPTKTVVFPEPMLTRVWHLDGTREDQNNNGQLDPGEDKNGNGLLDRGNERLIAFDKTGQVSLIQNNRVYGGPLAGSGVRITAVPLEHDADAGTIRLKFEVTSDSEAQREGALSTDTRFFPAEWNVRFASEEMIEVIETVFVPTEVQRERKTTVMIPVVEQQINGNQTPQVIRQIPEERVAVETVRLLQKHQNYLQAHPLSANCRCQCPGQFDVVQQLDAVAGKEAIVELNAPGDPALRAVSLTSSTTRHGKVSFVDRPRVDGTDKSGIGLSYLPAADFTGWDVFQFRCSELPDLDPRKWGLIAACCDRGGLVANDLFRVVSPVAAANPDGTFTAPPADEFSLMAMKSRLGMPPMASGPVGICLIPIVLSNDDTRSIDPAPVPELVITVEPNHGKFVGVTLPVQAAAPIGTPIEVTSAETRCKALLILNLQYRSEPGYAGSVTCRYKLKHGKQESAEATLRLWVLGNSSRLPAPNVPNCAAPAPGAVDAAPAPAPAPPNEEPAPAPKA